MSTTTTSLVTPPKLVSRYEIAERAAAFRLEKPSNWIFQAVARSFILFSHDLADPFRPLGQPLL